MFLMEKMHPFGSLDNQGSNCSQKLGVNEFIIGEVLMQLSFDFILLPQL